MTYARAELDGMVRDAEAQNLAHDRAATFRCPIATRLKRCLELGLTLEAEQLFRNASSRGRDSLLCAALRKCEDARDVGVDLTMDQACDVLQVLEYEMEETKDVVVMANPSTEVR